MAERINTECTYTRKHLARHHRGHLFALQHRRIERHLASCEVCRSELDALRQIDATRQILGSLEPVEGLGRLAKVGAAFRVSLLRLLHRPLWMLLIVAAAVSVYQYVINPLLHDPDLERLDAPATHTVPQAALPASAPSVSVSADAKKGAPATAATEQAASPLVITITMDQDKETSGIRRINDAMKEHPALRTKRFGKSVREISGNLSAGELHVFFNRIDGAGKVSYRRSRLAAAGEGDLLPFVMRLVTVAAPSPPVPAPPRPAEKPAVKPADTPAPQPESEAAPVPAQGQ